MNDGPDEGASLAAPPPSDFRRRFLRWALFCIPIAYLMLPLGALIHEVLGHGLVARLHGGTFGDFFVTPWGEGGSNSSAPGFEVQVLVAGSAAEAVLGLIALFAAGRMVRGGPWCVGLLMASTKLLESACFVLILGGFHEEVPGLLTMFTALTDFSRVAVHLDDPGLRSWCTAPGFLDTSSSYATRRRA